MGSSQNETRRSHLATVVFSLILFAAAPAQAVLPVYTYDMYTSSELINPQTQEIDLSMLSKLSVLSDPFQFRMTDYISVKGLTPTPITSNDRPVPLKGVARSDDDDHVARMIIQNTMQNLFDSHREQYPGIIDSARSLNQSMKTQYGSSKNSVKVKFEPFTTKGEISYSGELPVQSSLAYLASQQEMRFEISRKLSGNQTVAYTHVNNTDQRKDLVGIRWNF